MSVPKRPPTVVLVWVGLAMLCRFLSLLRLEGCGEGPLLPEVALEEQRETAPPPVVSAFHPTHSIPNVLLFTYRVNLLLQETNLTKPEEFVLRDNVQNIIALHPGAHVRFLTDEDCVQSLHNVNMSELVPFFRREKQGMYRGDVCRGAALLESGGLYFDVDLGVRGPVWEALSPTTEFATIQVYPKSNQVGGFFQAFIAATPGHLVLREYLHVFLEYYQSQEVVHGFLGVLFLRKAYDRVHSSLRQNVELWQETKYRKSDPRMANVSEPTWGKRSSCKFVVVTGPEPTAKVPFYSRIANSRMCPQRNPPPP